MSPPKKKLLMGWSRNLIAIFNLINVARYSLMACTHCWAHWGWFSIEEK